MLRFILSYYRSIIIALIILILTMIPGNNISPVSVFPFPMIDKLAHFIVFFVLSLFLFADIRKNNPFSLKKTALLVFSVNFFYGLMIEILQLFFILYRSAEFLDLVANTLGIIAGCMLQIKYRIIRY